MISIDFQTNPAPETSNSLRNARPTNDELDAVGKAYRAAIERSEIMDQEKRRLRQWDQKPVGLCAEMENSLRNARPTDDELDAVGKAYRAAEERSKSKDQHELRLSRWDQKPVGLCAEMEKSCTSIVDDEPRSNLTNAAFVAVSLIGSIALSLIIKRIANK